MRVAVNSLPGRIGKEGIVNHTGDVVVVAFGNAFRMTSAESDVAPLVPITAWMVATLSVSPNHSSLPKDRVHILPPIELKVPHVRVCTSSPNETTNDTVSESRLP